MIETNILDKRHIHTHFYQHDHIVLVYKTAISLASHSVLHTNARPRQDANQNLTRLHVRSCHFSLVNITASRPRNMFSAKGVLCWLTTYHSDKTTSGLSLHKIYGDFQNKCRNAGYRRMCFSSVTMYIHSYITRILIERPDFFLRI